ncbi:hypothetical protein SYNPS1DRAFT_28390 [Syncephalis pseudoplumigaleata]|uniref:WD40-repeat-containing domain protein n=1 Tax=Syncephalis pseudoplumigaleata TaxID=1712513 RepID=A0A4P9Z0T4_9FUNG|nr:hypothetical protein SYNPS1DRAFT_28390 [Syncephalis pseudoplumigaleata]|eukprot:RKP25885.1 hypothetical protein SYNPS1DRAFT_28390 [Syncephalis pseudoplumigaleata]
MLGHTRQATVADIQQTDKHALIGPVTAAQFLSDTLVLVAVGSFVRLYTTGTGELLGEADVLGPVRVHHLVVAKHPDAIDEGAKSIEYLVAVAGGKSMAFMTVRPSMSSGPLVVAPLIWQLSDWILDVQWIYAEDDAGCQRPPTEIAIVYAHNYVEVWSYPGQEQLHRIHCEEKCLLDRYAARFHGHHLSMLRLAAGTVFNKVLVWSPCADRASGNDRTVDLQLAGHEAASSRAVWPSGTDMGLPVHRRSPRERVGGKPAIATIMIIVLIIIMVDAGLFERADDIGGSAHSHSLQPRWWPARGKQGGITDGAMSTDVEGQNVASKEGIRNFVYIHPGTVVISTFSGYILQHALHEDTWQRIHHDDALISYCMMSASPDSAFIVCGSIAGQLTLLSMHDKERVPLQWKPHTEKIFDIYILHINDDEPVYEILSITWLGDLVWYRYDASTHTLTAWARMVPPPHTVVVSVDYDAATKLLVCGAREGALLVYAMEDVHTSTDMLVVRHAWELRRAHGRNAVTAAVFRRLPGTEELTVWTTGRDGAYAQWRVHQRTVMEEEEEETVSIELERVFYSKITKGWLERIYFMDNQVLLGGFFHKRFFLYNETRHYEMLSVACGGSHRRWRFLLGNAKLENTVFAFMRMEKVLVYTVAQSVEVASPPKLQANFHGREVRTVQWIATGNHPVLLSGGEDGYLCLSQVHPTTHGTSITPYCRVKAHSSVIRASALLEQDGSAPLLVTCGGADELRIWRIHIDPSSSSTGHAPPAVSIHELSSCPSTNASTSIKFKTTDATHIVAAAYSDAFVRIWSFSETTKTWRCLAQSDAHQQCILSCAMAWMHGHPLLVTGATNGSVYVWDLTSVLLHAYKDACSGEHAARMHSAVGHLQPALKVPLVHQSGVNCLDVRVQPSDGTITIATGGDDNALNVIELAATMDHPRQLLEVKRITREPNAHASALQGCRFLPSSTNHAVVMVTVAWDLRLQWWQLTRPNMDDEHAASDDTQLPVDATQARLHTTSKPNAATSLALLHSMLLNVNDPSALALLDTSTTVYRHHHHHSERDMDRASTPSPMLLAIAGMGAQVIRMTPSSR